MRLMVLAFCLAGTGRAAPAAEAGLDFGRAVDALALSPDGNSIAARGGAGAAGLIRIWDARTSSVQAEIALSSGGSGGLAFSPNGRFLAGANGGVPQIWASLDGAPARGFPGENAPAEAVAFSADGRRLASLHGRKAVLWDVAWQKPVRVLAEWPEGSRMWALAFSPDGKQLVVAGERGEDGRIAQFDAAGGMLIRTFSRNGMRLLCAAFSPDGRGFAAGGRLLGDKPKPAVVLWDARAWREKRLLEAPGSAEVVSVAFSPDGKLLATVTRGRDAVALWEPGSGRLRKELSGLGLGEGGAAVFGPGGRLLAAGGSGRVLIRAIDGSPGKEL